VLNYHLVLSSPIDLEKVDRNAQLGKCPRHVMWGLSQRLKAKVHVPGKELIAPSDYVRAKILGQPQNWALARHLSSQLTGNDVVFCSGEDVGIPIATLCGALPNPPKIAVFIHTGHRPRSRAAFRLFHASQRISLFVTNCRPQVEFLHDYLQLPSHRVFMLPEQTDTHFFSPGAPLPGKQRPIIASVGLEKRDYRTLAAATHDMDVDVRISAFSADVRPLTKSLPAVMPANMTRRYYEWTELVQLYRDADLVVVPLFESRDTAGVTGLLEAMACRRPVIVTRIPGLADYLESPNTLTLVAPEDAQGMRRAIARLLGNPQAAAAQAQTAYELVTQQHNSEDYIEKLAARLESLHRISSQHASTSGLK
jgi:glycosyltransferase involved in cell wall biosynthesis